MRRSTIDREWNEVVSSVAAMTAYRGPARPDRYDAVNKQHGTDRFALGKKMKFMLWPRFTALDMVKARGGRVEYWLWGLGQVLSDGAGAFLSSIAEGDEGSGKENGNKTQTEGCTCPLFSSLLGRHPDSFTGFEWINFVLSVARERIEPDLLSAWCSAPLFFEELTSGGALSLSHPSRPFLPGYDSQKDTTWHATPHGYGRIRKNIDSRNAVFTADIGNTDQREVEVSFFFGFGVPTGTNPFDFDFDSDSSEKGEKFDPLELEDRENLIDMFTNRHSHSCPWWFHPSHQSLPAFFFKKRLAHHIRGSMLTCFIALSAGLKLNRPMEMGESMGGTGVDWVTASGFSFLPPECTSSSSTLEAHPMKKVFDGAVRELRRRTKEIWRVPVDENKRTKAWREGMPRMGTRRVDWGGTFARLRDGEGRIVARSWQVRNGEWEGADYEDSELYWGPEGFMRVEFELE